MGMFDWLTCEADLPGDPKPRDRRFQAKGLARSLAQYTIQADGSLVDSLGAPVKFSGVLNLHTEEDGAWFEYEARLIDGKLQGIEAVDIHRQPSRDVPI